MISFNEYLKEAISAEMKKAFSAKEKNNLKALFKEFNINPEELTFKKADKSVITNYPSSKKKQIIVVKANFENKIVYRGNTNTIFNFVICGEPKNHYTGTFGDGTKIFGDSTKWAKRNYPLEKIKEHALEVWVAELGEAGDLGAKAKLKELPLEVSKLEDFYLLSYNIKHLYESLKEYKELGEKMDRGNFDKDDVENIESYFEWVISRTEKLCKF